MVTTREQVCATRRKHIEMTTLHYNSDGGARRKGYQNLVLWACPKFISTPNR